ncbi:MAG: hypothetical protein QXK93_02660 [Candidatus Bathyarchaeia archaeon]
MRKEKAGMQATVATLLLVVSATVLACVVVEYAISIFEQTLQTSNLPYTDRIRKIESFILNQTDTLLNQTQREITSPLHP